MLKRFCFKCGKETDKLKDGYCKECLPKKTVKKMKDKSYELCSKCGFLKFGRKWIQDYDKNLKMTKTVCEVCSRKYGDYFEAVIQLRGDFQKRHIDFCERFLERLERNSDRMAFFTVSQKSDFEFDIKTGSKKAAQKLTKELSHKFGCLLTKSFTIHSRRAGKDIVRDTISCRF